MKKIIILNGPNLNLLGEREKSQYGTLTLKDIEKICDEFARKNDLNVSFFQSNIEGELINKIQEVGFSYDGIVLNAAAYTHTSVGISDSIAAVSSPVIEVHISNIHAREEFRSRSLISKNVKGIICGFGLKSYDLAIDSIIYK